MSLNEMHAEGELEHFSSSPEELESLLIMAGRRLADARITQLSPESRLVNAYQCVLACAKAALRARDDRVAHGPRQHFIMIKSLEFTLGLSPEEVAYCQSLRGKRHRDEYAGTLDASDTEAEEAVEFADKLLSRTCRALAAQ